MKRQLGLKVRKKLVQKNPTKDPTAAKQYKQNIFDAAKELPCVNSVICCARLTSSRSLSRRYLPVFMRAEKPLETLFAGLISHLMQTTLGNLVYLRGFSYSCRCLRRVALYLISPEGLPVRLRWVNREHREPMRDVPYENADNGTKSRWKKYVQLCTKHAVISLGPHLLVTFTRCIYPRTSRLVT
jgi:hypothetical protein